MEAPPEPLRVSPLEGGAPDGPAKPVPWVPAYGGPCGHGVWIAAQEGDSRLCAQK